MCQNQKYIPMNIKEPSWKELADIVKKARSASAPGSNGIPYKVYKNSPKILKHLWRLLKGVWRKGKIPSCWQKEEGYFIPKGEKSEDITQFRTISLLNVEGNIFFSIMARRMTSYMTDNNYEDISVQKDGVPGFSGCIEYTSINSQLIQEAKVNKKDLTVDLANAYGTIPHMLIQESLDRYHIPDHCKRVIRSYLSGIELRFTTSTFTATWQILQKRIVTGCTISVILFVMGINMIIKSGEREKLEAQNHQLTLGNYQIEARWVLKALEETVTFVRLAFKPKKSRALIIRKGNSTHKIELKVQEVIPSIIDNPVKCLRKWFDDSLSDKNNIRRIEQQVSDGMRNIDKIGLQEKLKAWIYQHGLLPRISWPLMLTAKLQLPFTSIVEEFKVSKTRLVMTLKESTYDKVRTAGVQMRTGRKWSASKAVSEAESRLRHKDIVGTVTVGRQGLGTSKRCYWKNSNTQ
ncbi:unnamed protein product [Mytilus coruscus]|uniref:Reverse transcriptase domain-containing protein n=1 Tax=Mytilus coruscus TaxID=42192 RepID=A0A6J8CDV4_MYTCO|nr:unnamed protein product [Mytilus coruscus]